MNGWNSPKIALVILASLLLGACIKKANDHERVLARVNGTELTLDEYRDGPEYLNYYSNLNITVPDQRLESLVDAELLIQEAKRKKIDEVPKIHAQIEQLLINELLHEELNKPERQIVISDHEALDFYNKESARFSSPETVHYAHILINLPDKKAARELAEKILKNPALGDPIGFAKLAAEYSADKSTLNNGGGLGIAMVPTASTPPRALLTWQTKLVEAASKISVAGGVYPQVIETDRGFHIVKLLDHQPARTASFAQAKPQILQYLHMDNEAKIYRSYIDELKMKNQIEVDTAVVTELTKSGALSVPDRPPAPNVGSITSWVSSHSDPNGGIPTPPGVNHQVSTGATKNNGSSGLPLSLPSTNVTPK